MAKYTVSNEGIAGPYLAVEAEDIETTEKLLQRVGIAHCKSSDIKDGTTGRIILRVYNVEASATSNLNNELQKVFP